MEDAFKLHKASDIYCTEEKGHDRVEKRKCSILPVKVLEQEATYEPWPGLETIVKVERERAVKGVTAAETAYYISDEPVDKA